MQDKNAFVKARNDEGAPADGQGSAVFDSVDANRNGQICVRPLPDTPGNPAWYVVVSDDTIPPRK